MPQTFNILTDPLKSCSEKPLTKIWAKFTFFVSTAVLLFSTKAEKSRKKPKG